MTTTEESKQRKKGIYLFGKKDHVEPIVTDIIDESAESDVGIRMSTSQSGAFSAAQIPWYVQDGGGVDQKDLTLIFLGPWMSIGALGEICRVYPNVVVLMSPEEAAAEKYAKLKEKGVVVGVDPHGFVSYILKTFLLVPAAT